jgi:hypothetical protein
VFWSNEVGYYTSTGGISFLLWWVTAICMPIIMGSILTWRSQIVVADTPDHVRTVNL